MKTRFINMFVAASMAALALISCNKDKGEDSLDKTGQDPINKELSKDGVVERLNTTGEAFIAAVSADDFKSTTSAVESVINGIAGADLSDIEGVVDDKLNAMFKEWSEGGIDFSYGCLRLYDFCGHYVITPEGSSYTKADDLVIDITDAAGVKSNLTAKFSDKVNKVAVYKYVGDGYNESADVEVPTWADLVITSAGAELLKAHVEADVKLSSTIEDFDLAKDAFTVASTVELAGYKISLEKANYADRTIEVAVCLSKGNSVLLSGSFKITGIDYVVEDNGDFIMEYPDAKSLSFTLDLMRLTQIKGAILDYAKFREAMGKLYENSTNETAFKGLVSVLNANFDTGVYFSSDVRQLSIVFEAMFDMDWMEWDFMPVLKFADGTTYTADQFFTEDSFGKLVEHFLDFVGSFEEVVYE